MPNPFKNLLKALEGGSGSIVGVDIGSAYLKVVQLRRQSGKAVLETYGELALGPYAGKEIGRAARLPPETLAEALRDLLREAHITTQNAGATIPFASSLVTTIVIPALDEKELSVAVPIEARKYVPVPISEVNLDWWIIPETPKEGLSAAPSALAPESDGAASPVAAGATDSPAPATEPSARKFHVLIAAIHNEAMDRFQRIIREAELSASFFEIEIFSAIRALFPQDLRPHAILDMGAGESKLYIIDEGLLRVSHIISHGAQDLTLSLSRALEVPVEEAERLKRSRGLEAGGEVAASLKGLLDFTFAEVNQAVRDFKNRTGRGVGELILSGGGANLPGIASFAQESCDIPVSRADPFSQVEAPAFLDAVLKAVGPEFSVALGAAFRALEESR